MTDAVTSSNSNVYGTTDTAAASAQKASTSADNFGAGMGKDTFLKLLVAQLKYQNPLSPTDSQQYMAQMAQFTQVEKLAEIQKSQTDLVAWQRTVAGQGMIGKQVTATLSSGTGDVRVQPMPTDPSRIELELNSPSGHALFTTCARTLGEFLDRTYESVPPSTEYSWLDFDLALSELLTNDRARD